MGWKDPEGRNHGPIKLPSIKLQIEKSTENLSQNNLFLIWGCKQAPPKYTSRAVPKHHLIDLNKRIILNSYITKRHGLVATTTALYSGSAEFKSQCGGQICWLSPVTNKTTRTQDIYVYYITWAERFQCDPAYGKIWICSQPHQQTRETCPEYELVGGADPWQCCWVTGPPCTGLFLQDSLHCIYPSQPADNIMEQIESNGQTHHMDAHILYHSHAEVSILTQDMVAFLANIIQFEKKCINITKHKLKTSQVMMPHIIASDRKGNHEIASLLNCSIYEWYKELN